MPVLGEHISPRVSVVIPEELLQKAKAHAKEAYLPLSTVMRVALAEYIRRNESVPFNDSSIQGKGE